MSFRKDAHAILLKYLDRLDRKEKLELTLMLRQWESLSKTLKEMIDQLAQKAETLTPDQLFRLQLYQEFQVEVAKVSAQYANEVTAIISNGQEEFAKIGVQSAQEMLDLSAKFYTRLPVRSIQAMVGVTQNGTPLHTILLSRYGDNAARVTQTLIESMALGRNPLETARLMGEDLDGNLWKSIQIARTEQMTALREAQTQAYATSGIVTGKEWLGEPDACPEICQPGIEDSPYPLDEIMDTHPNCRCGWAPIIE